MTNMHKPMFFFAFVFFLLGAPFFVLWLQGSFVIFWTVEGAALVQCWGSAAVLAGAGVMYLRAGKGTGVVIRKLTSWLASIFHATADRAEVCDEPGQHLCRMYPACDCWRMYSEPSKPDAAGKGAAGV